VAIVAASGVAGYVIETNSASSTSTTTAGSATGLGTSTITMHHETTTQYTPQSGIDTAYVIETVTSTYTGGTFTETSCSSTGTVTVTTYSATSRTSSGTLATSTTIETLTSTVAVNIYAATSTRTDCQYEIVTITTSR
jgi:hypothetical protein